MPGQPQPIAILKMGSTFPGLRSKIGDFEDWIRNRMPSGLRSSAQVLDPLDGALPDPAIFDGLIVSGSHSMVTNPASSDLYAMRWLELALRLEVPTLGLCYGHQMLACALGGEVGPVPGGPEIGVVEVRFGVAAQTDPLFGTLGAAQTVAVTHYQGISRMPTGAVVLGASLREASQAVRFLPWAWGVQFHPEFGPEALCGYIEHQAEVLVGQGLDPMTMKEQAAAWDDQSGLIARFSDWATARNRVA